MDIQAVLEEQVVRAQAAEQAEVAFREFPLVHLVEQELVGLIKVLPMLQAAAGVVSHLVL
jgi:hypothetical protein